MPNDRVQAGGAKQRGARIGRAPFGRAVRGRADRHGPDGEAGERDEHARDLPCAERGRRLSRPPRVGEREDERREEQQRELPSPPEQDVPRASEMIEKPHDRVGVTAP